MAPFASSSRLTRRATTTAGLATFLLTTATLAVRCDATPREPAASPDSAATASGAARPPPAPPPRSSSGRAPTVPPLDHRSSRSDEPAASPWRPGNDVPTAAQSSATKTASERPAVEPSAQPPATARPAVRRTTGWQSTELAPAARVRAAQLRRPEVERLFADAEVAFPPAGLLLRGFKREGELELWAASERGDPFRHVTTFGICFASGDLGPKRREGDGQVPEGFYTVTYFHPGSSYHLALRLSYPNEADRRLGDPTAPGSDIMIHGNCVSIGCISLGDDIVEELWIAATAARDRGAKVEVHLFPARDLAALSAEEAYRASRPFWENLQEGKSLFESTHRLPTIRVDATGRYHFDGPPPSGGSAHGR